jgi:hypothetical protein
VAAPVPADDPVPGADDVLDRALRYPFERPGGSFTFHVATGTIVTIGRPAPSTIAGRTPILAVGSNAAPEQLRRKFATDGRTGEIPVIRVTMRDHDVVHAARISRYGAVPATLARSDGTNVALHITFLDDEQLEVMHGSESVGAGYDLDPVAPEVFDSPVPLRSDVLTYRAVNGPLHVDGEPVALAAVTAGHRRFPVMDQRQALDTVAAMLGTDATTLVTSVAASPAEHARVNERLVALRQAQRP